MYIVQTYSMYIFLNSKFSIERSSFFYISIIQIMKRIQLPILCFNESAFSYFSCLELNDFTPFNPNKFWGRNPRPPSTTYLQYQNYHVICVCVDREGLAIVQKSPNPPPPPPKNKAESWTPSDENSWIRAWSDLGVVKESQTVIGVILQISNLD